MHTLLIHPNFPSQFGHLAMALSQRQGDRVTFLTAVVPPPEPLPFDVVTFKLPGKPISSVFNYGKTPEEIMELAKASFTACLSMPDLKPDVVLGHGTYGTWLFLRTLYDVRFINYHEILPPPFWSEEFNLRPDYPPSLNARCFNAVYHNFTIQQLMSCDAAYSPTHWQRNTAPEELRHKISVIHDGIDTDFFCKRVINYPYQFRGLTINEDTRVITFLSRGLESFRGFDMFIKAMRIVLREVPDALVLIAGSDRVVYGHDLDYTGGLSFKEYVLSEGGYDLDRIRFVGWLTVPELPIFWSLSNCHVYLTVPWVLSWSCIQAMSCCCPMVVSATAPLREVMINGIHGMKAEFFSPDDIATNVMLVLKDYGLSEQLSQCARLRALNWYSLPVCIPRIIRLLEGKKTA